VLRLEDFECGILFVDGLLNGGKGVGDGVAVLGEGVVVNCEPRESVLGGLTELLGGVE